MRFGIELFVSLLGLYFMVGLAFGIYFVVRGAKKIDPLVTESNFSVRLLLLPGSIIMWPFLIKKAFRK